MILLNPVLLGGLAAVAVPIAVHIIHRRRVTHQRWGAMRFLHDMMARSRSRLLMDQWVLLAVRMGLILALALALTRPAGEPDAEGALVRSGKSASVILFDNSASSTAGRGASRLAAMKALASAYLDTLDQGDEVSLISLSDLGDRADPIYDIDRVRRRLDAIEATHLASDVPALMTAGIAQLERHVNPNVELVLIGDGAADGWDDDASRRWQALREGFDPSQAVGTRGRPRLVVLDPGGDEEVTNLAVTGLSVDRFLIGRDQPVTLRVRIRHLGRGGPGSARLRLRVDGRTIAERDVAVERGDDRELAFVHRFDEVGSHAVIADLVGSRDALAEDDQRRLAVDVVERMPVLLVEGRRGPGLVGSGAFVAVALDPDPEDDDAALFEVERIGSADLGRIRLTDYRVVVLADVRALASDGVAAVERFVAEGGGLVVGFGPGTDPAHVNRLWARDGDGFLACPVAADARGREDAPVPRIRDRQHPVLRAFAPVGQDAWSSAPVRRYLPLALDAVPSGEIEVPLALSDGAPLLVLRRRGRGTVAVVATSLDLSWSELPVVAGFVPLVRDLVAYLAGGQAPSRNLLPGEGLTLVQDRPLDRPQAVAPDGRSIALREGSWEGRPAFTTGPLKRAGLYQINLGDAVQHHAVNLDVSESRLEPLTDERVEERLGVLEPVRLHRPLEVVELFDPERHGDREWWRWLIAVAVALALAELWLQRRQALGATG